MSYRDDLEAAHARIAALEKQLSGVGVEVGEIATTLAKTVEVERATIRIRDELAKFKERQEVILAKLREPAAIADADLQTLTAHNRAAGPTMSTAPYAPAGVACPMCFVIAGETVEMILGSPVKLMVTTAGKQSVYCPACEFASYRRD